MTSKTKKTETTIIDTVSHKALGVATKVNDLALHTTEKVAMKSISLAEKAIELSSKTVKKGLKTSAKNQELVFNTLETVKAKTEKFLPKFK